MTEYYFALRAVHMTCAALTIALFLLRGLMMLAGSPLLTHPAVRIPPMIVDTVLLVSALMLTTVIHQYPFTTGWLTAKVVLLVVYVVLGTIALRGGRSRPVRVGAFVAALVTVGCIVVIARAHALPWAPSG